MTVAATLTQIDYTGNGSGTQYSFPNKIFQASDLVVTLTDTNGNQYSFSNQRNVALGLSYTVQNVDVDTGCLVVFSSAIANGWAIDLRSAVPETQATSIKNQGAFLPELHEEAFDRLTRELQDLRRLTYLFGVHGPDTETAPWPQLPGPLQRLGLALMFDPVSGALTLGTPVAGTITGTLIAQLLNPVTTIAPIGDRLLTQGESAAGVTIANYNYLPGDLRRYGADPTGVNDSAPALQAAVSCNADVFDGYPGGGTYLLNSQTVVTNFPIKIRGQVKWPISNQGVNGTKFVLASAAGTGTAHLAFTQAVYGADIEGIGFTWQSATQLQFAIHSTNDFRFSSIRRCSFINSLGAVVGLNINAIQLDAAPTVSEDVVIDGNFFDVLGACVVLGPNCTTIKITNNDMYGHAGVNAVASLGAIVPGTGYTPGTYNNVPLTTSGTGGGMTAQITVGSGGGVTSVILVQTGSGNAVNDSLSASQVNIGPGSGFSVPVASVGNNYGIAISANLGCVGPQIANNYMEGWGTGIYGNNAAYVQQSGNEYGPNGNHFMWVRSLPSPPNPARLWNSSMNETFPGNGLVTFPEDGVSFCTVLSQPATIGAAYLDSAVMNAGLGFQEFGRAFGLGKPQAVPFAAGNFTGNGAMTWTVAGGGQVTYSYAIEGKDLVVWFDISGTIGGTVNTALQIAIPGGFTASAVALNPCLVTNGGAQAFGFAEVLANGSVISIFNAATPANWTAGTGGANGQIRIPVN